MSGNLSKGVFERSTSTGSKAFSFIVCLDAAKFVLVSVVILVPCYYGHFFGQSCILHAFAKGSNGALVQTQRLENFGKSEKCPLPVVVRRSKTSFLVKKQRKYFSEFE